jgi:phage terminase large subunit-like protein
VSIYFKTYAQDVQHLQSSSVYYVACDEELPYELWGEINFRRNAVDGYFSMVFTATLGQDEWRRAMEPQRGEDELLKGAWKKQVSLFDCQTYTDGTQSHWTDEKIQRTIALCGTDKEVLKRIYGKFVLSEGLKYSSFARSHNVIAPRAVPDNFHIFAGVDIGVGGDKNHPSTITFVAVSPRFDMGYVFKHWRGDDKIYTMSDVANKYIELREDLQITAAFYDYHARDFKTITDRMGMSFQMADKRHDVGEQIINTLFKNRMLFIFDTIENEPIMRELTSVMLNVDKRKLKDDSVDSLRYAITRIPWDWSKVGLNMNVKIQPLKQETEEQRSIRERNSDAQRMRDEALTRSQVSEIEQELEEWGSYLE